MRPRRCCRGFCAALSILHPLFPPLLALLYLPFSLCLSTLLSLFFLVRFSPSLFFFRSSIFPSLFICHLFFPVPLLPLSHPLSHKLSLSLLLPSHLSPSLSCDSATELAILQIVTASTIDSVARSCFSKIVKIFSLEVRKESNCKSFIA